MTDWLSPSEIEAVLLSLKVAFWATILSLPFGIGVGFVLARFRELALHGEYPLFNEIDIFALSNLKLAYSDIDNPEDLWATGIVYIEGSPATLRSTFPCARSVTSRAFSF